MALASVPPFDSPSPVDEYKRLAESFAQATWETDAHGLVVTDSPSWRAYTGQSLEQWLGEGWVGAIHPHDQEYALRQWQQAVAGQRPVDAEFRLRSPNSGWRWTNVRATAIRQADGRVQKWVGLNIDISERKRAQEQLALAHNRQQAAQLQATRNLLRATLDCSLDLIQVFEAVRNEQGEIVDFIWVLNNHASEKIYGDVVGKSLLQTQPGVLAEGIFDTFKGVVETGTPDVSERHYVHEQFEGWFHQSVVKLNDGVATTTADITGRKKAEQALQQSKALLQDVMDAPTIGIAVYKAIRNTKGQITDFVPEFINRASRTRLGGEDGTGKRFTDQGENGQWQLPQLIDVIRTGRANNYLREANVGGRPGWFAITNTPLDGERLVHTWQDVTERMQAQHELTLTQERLRATLDSSLYVIQAFQALRDEAGQIVDFTWTFTNNRWNQQYGDVIGKSLLQDSPGVVETGLFDLFVQVTETGVSIDHEQYYSHEQFDDQWFHQTLVKLGDGFVMNTEDITARKKAEQQAQVSQNLVQTVFDVSLNPIAYQTAVRDQRGTIVDFAVALENQHARQYAQAERRGIRYSQAYSGIKDTVVFKLYCQVVETGEPLNTEVPLVLNDTTRWFHLMAVKLDDGLVATAVDITERKNAAQQIQRLTEAVAQQATDNYHAVIDAIDQGYNLLELLVDEQGMPTDFRIRQTNRVWHQQTGLADAVGKTLREVTPSFDQSLIDAYAEVALSGQGKRLEYYAESVGRWYTAFATRTGGAQSRQIAVVFDDITERKHQQLHQAFLLNLSDALRAAANADAIANRALELLSEQLGLDRCYIAVYRLEADRADIPYQVGNDRVPPLPQGGIRLSDFPQALRVVFDRTLVIDEVAQAEGLSETDRRNMTTLGLGALIAATLRTGEHNPHWVIVAVSAAPRRWTKSEIRLVEEVTERTWAAIVRVQAEEALHQSESRLRVLLENLPDYAIFRLNSQGRITEWTPGAQRVTSYSAQEAIGQHLSLFYLPESVAAGEVEAELAEAARTGRVEREGPRLRKNGEVYVINEIATALYDEAGQLVGFTKISRDITDRKRLEEALLEASRRKDEFLAMLAHELRNPMSTIRSGLQILSLSSGGDEMTTSTVSMMSRQTDHLVRMVDDLLDVSRISRGKIELKTERVNLVELVKGAVDSVRSLYQEQGKRLQVDLPTAPIYLEGDATRLTQVVANLLTNGVRYTGEQGQVWLSLSHRDKEAILQVRDNGIGLPADQLTAIFELFVQVDNSTARSKGGLGLGLTLVKRLVEMHGGRVEAQSEGVGQGSTFRVHLPTLLAAAEPIAKAAQQAPGPSTPRRVLVIDDNADAALMMSMLLKLKGYEVHTQNSGRAGIEAAESWQPEAILLDIGMPQLDGYETCRLIRQQSWGQAMVVIALTGYGQEEDRQRTREAGFNGHLVKPVDLGALTKMLTDLLDKGQNNARLE